MTVRRSVIGLVRRGDELDFFLRKVKWLIRLELVF